MYSQARETKNKNKQMGLYQAKYFCAAKKTINKTKRQPTKWEKVFANHISDKRLISKIYEEFIQFTIKK